MSNNQPQSTSSSNPLSNIGSSISNAFSGLGSGLSNIFTGGSDSSLAGDPSGMSGYDVAGLFGNLGSNAFDEATGSAQATQAITPPAQAQAAAAQGQDPSAGIGGAQTGTQTASTGPADKQPPSQEQQDQDARNKGVDELRRLLNQRNKNKPWQYPPREIAAFQAQPGIGRGPAGIEAGLYSPNISPDAAVRAGLLAPEMIDPTTGQIRRDVPASEAPAPDESGPIGRGQVVPRTGTTEPAVAPPAPGTPAVAGEEGRQITVQPRAAGGLPARTVPGTPGAAPGTGEPWTSDFTINGLGGLGNIPWWLVRALGGAAGGAAAVPFTATPAETGELPPYKGPSPEDYPDSTNYPTGLPQLPKQDPPDPPLPPPRPRDKPATKPATADRPRQVWVPETPGHYVPTTGIGRGGGTWVPGTPGHYVDAPPQGPTGRTTGVNDIGGAPRDPVPALRAAVDRQGSPPAADSASAGLPTRKEPEAGPGPSVGLGGPTGQSQMMREVLGGLLPAILPELGMMALAMHGGGRGRIPLGGLGGMRGFGRFPHRWGGGPLRPGYYPHPSGGMAYHPGGYHPGWGGEGRTVGPLAQPRPGNWSPGTWSPGSGRAPPRNVRNMNPGNIIDGPWARSQPGYAGSDGHFARFATGEDGMRAMQGLLQNYGRGGRNTIRSIVAKWAPAGSGEGNRPDIYAAAVGRMAGLRPDEPIDFNNPEVMRRIAMAMAAFEGGIAINQVGQAFGGQPATASAAAGGGGLRGRLSITDPNPDPLTSHAYPAPGETSGAPPYAGSDQPADINANVG